MGSLHLRRSAVGVVVLVVALLGAGCEEEDPSDPVAPTHEPIPPHTSTTSDPTTPTSAAEGLSPTGVVRGWVEALNAALDGEAADIGRFTTSDCWTCDEHLAPITETINNGGWFRGGLWTVVRARPVDRNSERISVYAAISAADGTTAPRKGAEPRHYEAEKFILDFRLKRADGQWAIAEIVYLR